MSTVIKIERDVLNLTEELTGERQSGASKQNQETSRMKKCYFVFFVFTSSAHLQDATWCVRSLQLPLKIEMYLILG